MNSDFSVSEPSVVQPQGNDGNTQSTNGNVNKEPVKRVVKPTEKALLEKLESLQKIRKFKLNKASNLKTMIQGFMVNTEHETEVKSVFAKFQVLCTEAKEAHESLMGLLPDEEKEKHDIWFKAKMLSANEFSTGVFKWLSLSKDDTMAQTIDNEARPKYGVLGQIVEIQGRELDPNDGINPDDSISNIKTGVSNKSYSHKESHSSSRSKRSSHSSILFARLQAEAERAALVARAASLKEKHTLEEQVEVLRRKKEQMDLDADLAASTAKLSVLKIYGASSVISDGMESYFEKETKQKAVSITRKSEENPNPSTRQKVNKRLLDIDALISQQEMQDDTESGQRDPLGSESQRHANKIGVAQKPQLREMQYQLSNGESQGHIHEPIIRPRRPQMHEGQSQPTVQENSESATLHLLQRQNDIAELLIQQHNSHLLPPRDVPIFEGDPLQYRTFIKAFEYCVEEKTSSKGDCLYFLERYTRGQPRALVRSCQHMAPERG
ncbi:uncharacterized protein LOC119263286 [Pygocentrus nattereri]|uniref:uncharacterized protein LOC119263286 n=1 Tax=Pygocentrus nattereri TaxID=42514 RepID=UPI001890E604|nr:uncharacterized protein LOC119263286 [Pygocentrus nattereri]